MSAEKKIRKIPETMFTHVPKTAGTFVYELLKHIGVADDWIKGVKGSDRQSPGRRLAFSHIVPCDLIGNKIVGNGFEVEVPQEVLDRTDLNDLDQIDRMMLTQLWEPFWEVYTPKVQEMNMNPTTPIFGFLACHADRFRNAKMSFGTIRNPFSVLVSYYHCAAIKPRKTGWFATNKRYGFNTFEKFVVAYCTEGRDWFCPSHKNDYYFQYKDHEGKWTVDYLVRQEHLRDGLVEIGFPAHKVAGYRKNKSSQHNKTYKGYYTPRLRQLVEKKMAYELETFGYDFDGPTDDRKVIEVKRGTDEQPEKV